MVLADCSRRGYVCTINLAVGEQGWISTLDGMGQDV
jgi:hypothetical protein